MNQRELHDALREGVKEILYKYNDIAKFCGVEAIAGHQEVENFFDEIPDIANYRVESFGSTGSYVDDDGKVVPGYMKCEITYRQVGHANDSLCIVTAQWKSKVMAYQLRNFDAAMKGV